MLTTIHDDCMTTKVCRTRRVQGGQEEIRKPVVVEQYNQFMGGVDRSDQLLSYYGFADRTVKWWRRAVFYLLDMAVVNAYVLHTHINKRRSSVLSWHSSRPPQMSVKTCLSPTEGFRVLSPPQSRLTERHFPDHLPCTPSGKRGQTECAYAARREGISAKPPPTCASSVDSQCASSRVLNCTTPKWTHSDICEHSILFSRHPYPLPLPHHLYNLVTYLFTAPLAT